VREHFERSFCFFHFFRPAAIILPIICVFIFFRPAAIILPTILVEHFFETNNEHLSAMYFLFALSQSELAQGWWDNLDR